ncbi:methyltransferase domain-containing protein [Winogradskyella sp. 3972H.M.0a.05]|uniref:class I SAM-dependent methyltransferase n=1 Tax=Winogradskyella sp. 3972H.M.0a.05 TaxID=2950277 RepID=UPI0033932E3A
MEEQKPCVICNSSQTSLWCQSKDLEYHTTDEIYTFYKCGQCSTIFIADFLVDQLPTIYPSNYYSFSKQKKTLGLKVKNYLDRRLFKRLLSKFNNRPINVLDVGGGSGWLLNTIKEIYPNINVSQIIDIDLEAKNQAEKDGHEFFHGTVEEFETDVSFDVILMLNLIEHISNPEETLNKLSKVLKPDGTILIKTPNVDSLDARLFRKRYWGGLHCPRHWILFSEKSFRQLISRTPLSVKTLKHTQGAPFWAWSILALLKQNKLIKTSKEKPMIYHPLVPILNVLFAGFDFLRGALGFKTSQMFVELEK